jgi:hypothetical protein
MATQSATKSPSSSAKRKSIPLTEEDLLQEAAVHPHSKTPKLTKENSNPNSQEKVFIGVLPKVTPLKADEAIKRKDSGTLSAAKVTDSKAVQVTPTNKNEHVTLKKLISTSMKTPAKPVESSISKPENQTASYRKLSEDTSNKDNSNTQVLTKDVGTTTSRLASQYSPERTSLRSRGNTPLNDKENSVNKATSLSTTEFPDIDNSSNIQVVKEEITSSLKKKLIVEKTPENIKAPMSASKVSVTEETSSIKKKLSLENVHEQLEEFQTPSKMNQNEKQGSIPKPPVGSTQEGKTSKTEKKSSMTKTPSQMAIQEEGKSSKTGKTSSVMKTPIEKNTVEEEEGSIYVDGLRRSTRKRAGPPPVYTISTAEKKEDEEEDDSDFSDKEGAEADNESDESVSLASITEEELKP